MTRAMFFSVVMTMACLTVATFPGEALGVPGPFVKQEMCKTCNGTGRIQCPVCKGQGKVEKKPCGSCRGSKKIVCPTCGGAKHIQR